ncbi:hypothetical protein [uncultured Croceitalea sp.]|uniref:hypothetical protein n=1 Tax=uncultured Croceitalea sp. TaxID=1798908 RepID=UPI003305EB8D
MKNTFYLFAIAFMVTFYSNAQLNDYKYIVIPKKLKEFKKENQYQTSTLLKYLFVEASYNAIYDDALPDDLKKNGCLAVKADLENESSLFATKIKIIVKDCNGQVVFTSIIGKSKKKDYKAAYNEAITKAFKSFELLNYNYKPRQSEKEEPITVSFKNDVKSLENKETTKKPVVVREAEAAAEISEKAQEHQSVKGTDVIVSKTKETVSNTVVAAKELEVLYAQPTENGFQLVDSTPKIQYKLIETSVENVFLATHGDKNGVILNNNGKWFFEYNEEGEKILKELNIKF